MCGLSFSPIAHPSLTCSNTGGGPSIMVIFSIGREYTTIFLQRPYDLPYKSRPAIDQAGIDLNQGRAHFEAAFGVVRTQDAPDAHDRNLSLDAAHGSLKDRFAPAPERGAA